MKPIGLFAYQIENSSKINDIVIDAFGGSGTTAFVANENGRNAILCEINPEYVELSKERLRSVQPPLFTI